MKLSPVRWILAVIVIMVLLFALIQLVPYGKDHTNPRVLSNPAWDSSGTEMLVRGACYDCHSNETTWPWYSNVAPASWMVYRDVVEARATFNFNELTIEQGKNLVGAMTEMVAENIMPPLQYTAIHAEARFSTAERQEIIDGLLKTFK